MKRKVYWITWGIKDADRAGFPSLVTAREQGKAIARRSLTVELYDCSNAMEIHIGTYQPGGVFRPDPAYCLAAIRRLELVLLADGSAETLIYREFLNTWSAELNQQEPTR